MTTQTAENLALELEEEIDGFPQATTLERKAAAMLRSQAAEIERLKSSNESYITLANTAYEITAQHTAEIERLKSALNNCEDALMNCDAVLKAGPIIGFKKTVIECNKIALDAASAALEVPHAADK